ncbi:uncharacterized protein O3C94_006176 isoform 2-T2 [Discoglossus pictus]
MAGRGVTLRTYSRRLPIQVVQADKWLSPAGRRPLFSSSSSSSLLSTSHASTCSSDSDFRLPIRKKSVAQERTKEAMQTLPPRHQSSKKSMRKQKGTKGTKGSRFNTNDEGKKDRSEEKKSVPSRRKARPSNKEKESSMSKENDAPFDRIQNSSPAFSTPFRRFVTIRRKSPAGKIYLRPRKGRAASSKLQPFPMSPNSSCDFDTGQQMMRERRKLHTDVMISSPEVLHSPLQKVPLLSSTPSVLSAVQPKARNTFVQELSLFESMEESVVKGCMETEYPEELQEDAQMNRIPNHRAPRTPDSVVLIHDSDSDIHKTCSQRVVDSGNIGGNDTDKVPDFVNKRRRLRSTVRRLKSGTSSSPTHSLSKMRSVICIDDSSISQKQDNDSIFCASAELFSNVVCEEETPQEGNEGRLVCKDKRKHPPPPFSETNEYSLQDKSRKCLKPNEISMQLVSGARVPVCMVDTHICSWTVQPVVRLDSNVVTEYFQKKYKVLKSPEDYSIRKTQYAENNNGKELQSQANGQEILCRSDRQGKKQKSLIGSQLEESLYQDNDQEEEPRSQENNQEEEPRSQENNQEEEPRSQENNQEEEPRSQENNQEEEPRSQKNNQEEEPLPLTVKVDSNPTLADLCKGKIAVVCLDAGAVTKYFLSRCSVSKGPINMDALPVIDRTTVTQTPDLHTSKGKSNMMFSVVPPPETSTTGRKVCISGYSAKRWGNRPKKANKSRQAQLSFRGESDMSLQRRKMDVSACSTFSSSFLPSPSLLTSSFLNSSMVMNLSLSPDPHRGQDPRRDKQRWLRLRAALSLHRKKKVEAALQCQQPLDRSLLMSLQSPCSLNLSQTLQRSSLLLLSPRSPTCCDELTDAEKVFVECQQVGPVPFSSCLTSAQLGLCEKVGEGVYGEVFKTQREAQLVALKVIPIEGSRKINGEDQKSFAEILPEIIISKELSLLSEGDENCTSGFIQLHAAHCVQGSYPRVLLEAWDVYCEEKGSENERPDFFSSEQLFMILEFEFGGNDLERVSCKIPSVTVSRSILHQVTASLAVAEEELRFEHRDLHWGNLLIESYMSKFVKISLHGDLLDIPSEGVQVKIIDYTLSRLDKDGLTVFCDLSTDEDLFLGEGDLQFDVYRNMRKENKNSWASYLPYSNVLWLHYLADKLLTCVQYIKKPSSVAHRKELRRLQDFRREVRGFSSARETLQNSRLFKF